MVPWNRLCGIDCIERGYRNVLEIPAVGEQIAGHSDYGAEEDEEQTHEEYCRPLLRKLWISS